MADRELTAADIFTDLDVGTFELEADDFIVGAIVLLKIRDGHDQTGVYLRDSESINWLDRIALLQHAADVERAAGVRLSLGDDE